MGRELDLLRMLEPAVRPVQGGARVTTGATPIESKSFESLLGEAQAAAKEMIEAVDGAVGAGPDGTPPVAETVESKLIARLSGVDHVENPAVLRFTSGAGDLGCGSGASRAE